MSGESLQWKAATLTWSPEIARDVVILRIPAFIERYAALNLQDALDNQLPSLVGDEGRLISVEVQPRERHQDETGVSFDPGQIVIVAERLMRCFDPGQLRARIVTLADKAIQEGERQAEEDEEAAREFLNHLAADH